MKVYADLVQGSDEWRRVRAGVVTGSAFDNVLTPGTLKPAKRPGYLGLIVAERLTGDPCDDFDGSAWTDRGTLMEDEARSWYAFEKGVDVTRVGFIATDDGRVGCSPDGLVGDDGGLELKCPALRTHVGYAIEPDRLRDEYHGQTQAFLYVTGRKWIDLVSFNPVVAPVVVRVLPDAAYLAALADVLPKFLARVDEAVTKLAPTYSAPCPI